MIYEFTGSARERGRQHGEALGHHIRQRIVNALPRHDDDGGRLAELARPWLSAIESHDNDQVSLADELRGIAEGADVSLHAVVLLNAFEAFAVADQIELGGCTAVGISTPAGALIAQNWDANPSLARSIAVHVHRSGAGTTAMVASPGGLGWIGMSAQGVAVVNNDLVTTTTRRGLPSQALRRHALAAPSAAAALEAILATPPVGGRTYLIGDQRGDLITIELAADATPRVTRHHAPTAHTNHALAPEIAEVEDSNLLRSTYPSSHQRLRRARQLLARSATLEPEATARSILSDHDAHPLSICRHPSPYEQTVTAASAYFDCASRRAAFVLGNPCSTAPTVVVKLGPSE